MVGRGGVELDCQLHAAAMLQLIRVQSRREARGHAGEKDRARLIDIESASIAEDVNPLRVRGAGLEHAAGDERDVVVGPSLELGGHHVRAEVGGVSGDVASDSQRTGFVDGGEAVAGLRLECRDTAAPQFGREPVQILGKLLIGRVAGSGDGASDTAC